MQHQTSPSPSPQFLSSSSLWNFSSMTPSSWSPLSSLSAISASYLESLAPHLPDSLRSVISHFAPTFSKPGPPSLSSSSPLNTLAKSLEALQFLVPSFFSSSSSTTHLAVTVIALLLAILAMSWNPWRRLPSPPSPLRYTPPTTPAVTDDDYSYVTVNDADYTGLWDNKEYSPRRQQKKSIYCYSNGSSNNDESEPDVIFLKYRGASHKLNFPAYAIGDGIITVGNVKLAAANALGVADTRQIKLLYKGRLLKDDFARARDVGLKQNSATMCVISRVLPETSSEESILTPPPLEGSEIVERSSPPAVNGGSGGGAGSGRRKRRHRERYNNTTTIDAKDPARNPSTSRSRPIPMNEQPAQQSPRSPHTPLTSHPRNSPNLSTPPLSATTNNNNSNTNRSFSSSKAQPPSNPSPRPSSLPTPSPNLNTIKSPQAKLSLLSEYFHSTLKPLLNEYVEHTPTDQKTRDFEHRKLSETTMAQLILKVDGIEIDGDEEVRQQRRTLILTVQNALKRIDEAQKRG
ncbi:hypothetical protein PABG_02125 [Paracoccidioides brasiliensis Pb03]|nr:hypothetical protein PABG_02125 [Paracoccidioides brasiliensis Pb03]